MTQIHDLLVRAKEAFDIAAAIETVKPCGVAIRMKSGLILTGYGRSIAEGDAAKDALRSAILCFPTDDKVAPSILDNYTIAAVAVVNASGKISATGHTMKVLRRYNAVAEDAYVYMASPQTDGTYSPSVSNMMLIHNKL